MPFLRALVIDIIIRIFSFYRSFPPRQNFKTLNFFYRSFSFDCVIFIFSCYFLSSNQPSKNLLACLGTKVARNSNDTSTDHIFLILSPCSYHFCLSLSLSLSFHFRFLFTSFFFPLFSCLVFSLQFQFFVLEISFG